MKKKIETNERTAKTKMNITNRKKRNGKIILPPYFTIIPKNTQTMLSESALARPNRAHNANQITAPENQNTKTKDMCEIYREREREKKTKHSE